jgi:hypothetical protein
MHQPSGLPIFLGVYSLPQQLAKNTPRTHGTIRNRLLERVLSQADAGTRTPDPLLTMEVLYQLSYVGADDQS